jgi:hypothetical protein
VTALIDQTNLQFPRFEDGDAGIILKADGSFRVWNTIKDPGNPTPYQLEQSRILLAFMAALKLPQIMDVLFQVASDPEIFPKVVEHGLVQ